MGYNTAVIRDLLTEAFNDEKLRDFCFDHFHPVYEQFTVGMTKGRMIQLLLEHCEQQFEMTRLLQLVQRAYPKQYAKHAESIGAIESPAKPSDHGPGPVAVKRRARFPWSLVGMWERLETRYKIAIVVALIGFLGTVLGPAVGEFVKAWLTGLTQPTATPPATVAAIATPTSLLTKASSWQQGKIVFVSAQTGHDSLYIMDLTVGTESRLLSEPPTAARYLSPWWSPDGKWLAFTMMAGGRRQVMTIAELPGSKPKEVGTGLQVDFTSSPTWSPDGRRIICYGEKAGVSYFFIIDAFSGRSEGQLAPRIDKAGLPAWSPNGDLIAFVTKADGNSNIYTMPLAGGNPINLTRNSVENYAPAWSPDGNYIAYQSDLNRGGGQSEIWVMDRTGKNPRQITHSPPGKWSRAPTWSPDGQWIAFVSNRTDNIGADYGELFVVSIKTEDTITLTNTGGYVYDWRPSWGP